MSDDNVLTKEIATKIAAQAQDLGCWPESPLLTDFSGIELDAAEIIAGIEALGDEIVLTGVSVLPEEVLNVLIKSEMPLILNLTELNESTARILSQGHGFYLPRLKTLTDPVAEILSNCSEVPVGLDGLTSLSDAAAESLSHLKYDLSLLGLTSLSEAAAESLSKHQGIGAYTPYLNLGNLISLSDAAAEVLAKHPCLRFCDNASNTDPDKEKDDYDEDDYEEDEDEDEDY